MKMRFRQLPDGVTFRRFLTLSQRPFTAFHRLVAPQQNVAALMQRGFRGFSTLPQEPPVNLLSQDKTNRKSVKSKKANKSGVAHIEDHSLHGKYAAALYRVCVQKGVLGDVWRDLEFLRTCLQGERMLKQPIHVSTVSSFSCKSHF